MKGPKRGSLFLFRCFPLIGALDDKGAALDGVDEDVAGLEEGVVAPGADELEGAAVGLVVVLGVDVEEAELLDEAAGGVLGEGADVDDAQAGAVVGLVGDAVDDELVVVDAVGLGLVHARLLGVLEVADVPEVGDGVAVGGGADAVVLVVLVVEDEELLPGGVGDPALVGVCI